MTVRLFLAINLPAPVRRDIRAATAPMRDATPDHRSVKWVDDDHLHITLKFLGEQPDDAVAALQTALDAAISSHLEFTLTLGGLGAFPNLRAPRVVWMGVTPEPKLELLQHDVERTCAALGYPLDARAFRPHITIGRAREGVAPNDARAIAAAARVVRFAASAPARSVDVMRSELGPHGSRHTLLASAPLGGAA
ncbi:MAG TPA: RNA 2',3'-cyclic phosphodiesterase [Gemmatimonadaceae bacterium]|nr:RNA 2',3'-cyclic phosphodiesterase [Gemmatimonadaceae bacterium]